MFKDQTPEILRNGQLIKNPCFCSKFWPIIALTQLIGINPLTLTHDKAHNSCKLQFERWSLPNFWNWFGICFNAYCIAWSQWNSNLRTYLAKFFVGTDLYVFGFQSIIMSFEIFLIIVLSRWRRASLAESFNKLSQAWNEVGILNNGNETRHQGTNKFWSWILVAVIVLSTAVYCILIGVVVFSHCFGNSGVIACDMTFHLIMQKLSHSLIPLYQLGASGFFFTLCLLIQSLHYELGRILKFVHQDPDAIDQVRRIHGKLCKATRFLTDNFGISLLCIMSTAVVTVTSGSYLIILAHENIVSHQNDLTITFGFFYARYFQMFFSVLSTILILIPAQMVTNSVSAAADSLYEVRLTDLDPKVQFQVSLFLQKVKPRNSTLTACNITNIGMTFVASAVTNAATYILVLLQFRLATTGLGMEKNSSSSDNSTFL